MGNTKDLERAYIFGTPQIDAMTHRIISRKASKLDQLSRKHGQCLALRDAIENFKPEDKS